MNNKNVMTTSQSQNFSASLNRETHPYSESPILICNWSMGSMCRAQDHLSTKFIRRLFYDSLIILIALTGFVCTYKIQAEEECQSSNIICYECDSRYDANCADPFELASLSLADQQAFAQQMNNSSSRLATSIASHPHNSGANLAREPALESRQQQPSNLTAIAMLQPKKMPNVALCHGCCVKITSKTPEGATYVKRTCTTSLQINFFMVGLVCMKESGDRGKMCFCETDYCNGQVGRHQSTFCSLLIALLFLMSLMFASTSTIQYSVGLPSIRRLASVE